MNCEHNHRCRYTTGFFCEDCHTFFDKASPTYRSGEYLSELWMACHNINARALQAHQPERKDALAMRDKIGIGLVHPDYEVLIAEVEAFLAQNNTSPDSATLVLNRQ